MSAKTAVLQVPTVGRKTTNMQLKGFHICASQNTIPVFMFGECMTCHSKLSMAISLLKLSSALNIVVEPSEVRSALGFRLFPRYYFRVSPCPLYALAAVRIGLSRRPAWYRGPSVAAPTPSSDHVTELCMPPDRLVHAMAYPKVHLTYSNVTCT